jgi:serine phosphatase RsbU (regulator of sigma subunit)
VGYYATIFFSVIDRDGTLSYVKAAHPSPLLLRRPGHRIVYGRLHSSGTHQGSQLYRR